MRNSPILEDWIPYFVYSCDYSIDNLIFKWFEDYCTVIDQIFCHTCAGLKHSTTRFHNIHYTHNVSEPPRTSSLHLLVKSANQVRFDVWSKKPWMKVDCVCKLFQKIHNMLEKLNKPILTLCHFPRCYIQTI